MMAVPAAYGAMAPPHPPFWGSCSLRRVSSPRWVQLVCGEVLFRPDLLQSSGSFYLTILPSVVKEAEPEFQSQIFNAGLALGSLSIQEKSKFRWHSVSIYQFGRCLKNVCILSFNNSILKKLLYVTKINAFLFTVTLVMLHKSGNKLHIQRWESG